MTLADRVRSLRTAKELSVVDLAKMARISMPYLWQIEAGRKRNPTGEVLQRLASALGTTVADLLGAPQGIPEEALRDTPVSLRQFVKRRGKAVGVKREDVEMLRSVHYRGRRPGSVEDWELVFLFLKRLLG